MSTKNLALTLLIVIALVLIACGGQTATQPAAKAPAKGTKSTK